MLSVCLRAAMAALLLTAESRVAAAQPAPEVTDVDLDERPAPVEAPHMIDPNKSLRIEVNLVNSGGLAFTGGLENGSYLRLMSEAMLGPVRGTRPLHPVYGFGWGIEGWVAPKAEGFGMPIEMFCGVRFGSGSRPSGALMTMRAVVAVDLFTVDVIDGVTGGGVFTPNAGLDFNLGGDLFRAGAEFRAAYRWQWALEDRVQLQLGATLTWLLVRDTTSP